MRKVEGWIGSELLHGTVYGLGMSVLVWISLSAGALADPRWGLVCLVAGLAGVSGKWAGWSAPAALPWILAAWVVEGPAGAVLVGVVATLGSALLHRGRGFAGRLAFDSGATALAVAGAHGLARWLDTGAQPEIVFALAYVVVQATLHGLRRGFSGTRVLRELRRACLSLAIAGAAVAAAWGLVALWERPAARVWLALLPAIRLGMLFGAANAARRARAPRRRVAPAPDRLRDRTAAALAQALPEGAPGGHLWRTQSLAVALAERLGCDPDEIRWLTQAALLHHVGQLAFEDGSVEVHPHVIEKTVEQLGFAPEVCRILAQTRECWNGDGPRGLRGERICRGARILTVADRYDQLAHGRTCDRNHRTALALLRNESNGRFDPLMFEILDELAERLEATGTDLTRPARVGVTSCDSGLVHGERDLQMLYSIERATRLAIGWHERMTLVAALLRNAAPFTWLRLERPGGEHFRYGDRDDSLDERSVALVHDGRRVGLLRVAGEAWGPANQAQLERVAPSLAAMLARDLRERAEECLTDPATGLPNARYLRRMLAQRIPETGHAAPGFGLIALRTCGQAALAERRGRERADRYLNTLARRIAAACDERETPVRFGPDQFLVLTGESRGGELVRRWYDLVEAVAAKPVRLDDDEETVRLDAAHATHPLDGADLEALLRTLESRLAGATTARVVPFPRRHAG